MVDFDGECRGNGKKISLYGEINLNLIKVLSPDMRQSDVTNKVYVRTLWLRLASGSTLGDLLHKANKTFQ